MAYEGTSLNGTHVAGVVINLGGGALEVGGIVRGGKIVYEKLTAPEPDTPYDIMLSPTGWTAANNNFTADPASIITRTDGKPFTGYEFCVFRQIDAEGNPLTDWRGGSINIRTAPGMPATNFTITGGNIDGETCGLFLSGTKPPMPDDTATTYYWRVELYVKDVEGHEENPIISKTVIFEVAAEL